MILVPASTAFGADILTTLAIIDRGIMLAEVAAAMSKDLKETMSQLWL